MSFLGVLKFLQVFGPDDLWESSKDINNISFLSVGVKKKVFVFVLDR